MVAVMVKGWIRVRSRGTSHDHKLVVGSMEPLLAIKYTCSKDVLTRAEDIVTAQNCSSHLFAISLGFLTSLPVDSCFFLPFRSNAALLTEHAESPFGMDPSKRQAADIVITSKACRD